MVTGTITITIATSPNGSVRVRPGSDPRASSNMCRPLALPKGAGPATWRPGPWPLRSGPGPPAGQGPPALPVDSLIPGGDRSRRCQSRENSELATPKERQGSQTIPRSCPLQLLKKLSQCLVILQRLVNISTHTWANILKVLYVILFEKGFNSSP